MTRNQPQTKLAKRIIESLALQSGGIASQGALGERLGMHQTRVSRLLQGKIKHLSPKASAALSDILGISAKEVLAELNEPSTAKPFAGQSESEIDIKEQLFQIADDFPYSIYLKSTDRTFLWANRAMLQTCNCSSLSQLQGLRDEDLFEDPHLEEARSDDEKVIKEKLTIKDKLEFETWKFSGANIDGDKPQMPRKLKLVVTTKKPFYQMGKIVGLIGFTHDYSLKLPEYLSKLPHSWDMSSFSKGIYHQNLKTKRIWSDEAFTETFPGHTVAQRLRVVHRDDRPRVAKFLRQITERSQEPNTPPESYTIDFRAVVRGKLLWIRGTAIAFGSGEEQSFICGHQEIAAQTAGEALAARALVSLPEKVFVSIKDGRDRYCFMNAPLLRVLELGFDEIAQKNDKELGIKKSLKCISNQGGAASGCRKFLPIIDYEEVVTKSDKTLKLMAIRMPIRSEIIDPNWFSSTAGPANANAYHTLGIAWDISDEEDLVFDQLSKSAWAGLLDSSDDAIYLKTAEGHYLSCNKVFATTVGKSRRAIVGMSTRQLFADQPVLLEAIVKEDESLVHRDTKYTQSLRKRRLPNGKYRFESSSKFAISDSTGKVKYILGISRDISNQMESIVPID